MRPLSSLTFTLPAASDLQGGAPNENNTLTYHLVAGSVQRNGVTISDSNITVNGNGTYEYNGQPVDQAPLRSGDRLKSG